MDILDIPDRITTIWASGVGSPYVNPIPETPSGDPGRAAFSTGFPALNFQSVSSGGVPPFGGDFNGLEQLLTAQMQWIQAGKLATYDGTFSTAIGGYPKGAIVESVTSPGNYWQSLVDDNTTNPDAGGANWKSWPFGGYFAIDTGTANAGSITISLPVADIDQLLGIPLVIVKGAAANTGTGNYTMTINGSLGSLGTFNVINANGNPLLPDQIQANSVFMLLWGSVSLHLIGGTPSLSANTPGGTSTAMVGTLPPGNAPVQILAIYPTAGVYTFTPPAGRYQCYGICTAAGGGGAGENTSGPFTGGGGGAGATAMGWFNTTPGVGVTINVGAAGTGGISGSGGTSNGLNGGSSSIGAFLSATGGTAGQSGANAAGGDGGVPTVAGTGVGLYGGYGGDGDIAGTGAFAGNGGASYWGGGLRAARGGPVATPAAAGSGGGGGYIGGNGSQGMPGLVVIIG